MIDKRIIDEGELIEYYILPEEKEIRLVSIKTESDFEKILSKYQAMKYVPDYTRLESGNDSLYGNLARISLVTVYVLSNGLHVIDQLVNNKANPYYICETLDDFKLITKYLTIFRAEPGWPLEVWCGIHDHFEIKKFLEKKGSQLEFVQDKSYHKLFESKTGQYVEVRYSDNSKGSRNNEFMRIVEQKVMKPIYGNKFEDEEIIYHSLRIYQSLEKLKLHNVTYQFNS